MNGKSQKIMKTGAIVLLSIAAVVFAVLYFTGKVDSFLGVSSETSESTVVSEFNESANAPNEPQSTAGSTPAATYKFRSKTLLNQHYEKHGKEMGFASAEEYEKAAAAVPNSPNVLHKTEKEDGDDVYYIESTNEFVVISTDGYIRTYFNPDNGIDYYNKQ